MIALTPPTGPEPVGDDGVVTNPNVQAGDRQNTTAGHKNQTSGSLTDKYGNVDGDIARNLEPANDGQSRNSVEMAGSPQTKEAETGVPAGVQHEALNSDEVAMMEDDIAHAANMQTAEDGDDAQPVGSIHANFAGDDTVETKDAGSGLPAGVQHEAMTSDELEMMKDDIAHKDNLQPADPKDETHDGRDIHASLSQTSATE